ncbi:Methyltransferase domain-containing protein [Limimonas halophila]|uniref:Methyltransferase domain-containing protein n=1 Tax=Limimonas halophila TaxID=1082479 RepID=A0A1G7RMG7_9PROT|nr:methyltransferase domain-containing protein [Limimonas halophila]SDG11912.1 Methyltransferase domain-containing protein [Limimonas halophila]
MAQKSMRIPREYVEKGRIPLWVRLKAWWEGYDIRIPEDARKKKKKHAKAVEASEKKKSPLQQERVVLMQEVWGKGFDRPCNPDYVVDLVAPVGLDSSMSVLDVGAGLGGSTRTICEAFNTWVTALEPDAQLAAAGHLLSDKAGLVQRAAIYEETFEQFDVKPRGYDCIFAKEAFFRCPDKENLFQMLEEGLKPGGYMLFTDYVLAEDAADSEALQGWRDNDPEIGELWTAKQYVKALQDLKLDVPTTEDISAGMTNAIKRAWATYMENAGEDSRGEEMDKVVQHESQVWNRRLRALESGDLRVVRFQAMKKEEGRMLSG